jgi:hypothetical protein
MLTKEEAIKQRHWGTANHNLGPCPKVSKVEQLSVGP